jgi:hypothetical protein
MSRRWNSLWTAALALAGLFARPAPAVAEAIHLKGGGLIEGRIVASSAESLRVELSPGWLIGLAAEEITRVQVIAGPADYLRWQGPPATPPPPRPLANPLPPRPLVARAAPVNRPTEARPGHRRIRASFQYYEGPLWPRSWIQRGWGCGRSYFVVESRPTLWVNGRLIREGEPPRVVVWHRYRR